MANDDSSHISTTETKYTCRRTDEKRPLDDFNEPQLNDAQGIRDYIFYAEFGKRLAQLITGALKQLPEYQQEENATPEQLPDDQQKKIAASEMDPRLKKAAAEVAKDVLAELQRIETVRTQVIQNDRRKLVKNVRDSLYEWRRWQALSWGDGGKKSEKERLETWRAWTDPKKASNLGEEFRKKNPEDVVKKKVEDNEKFATYMYDRFKQELRTIINEFETPFNAAITVSPNHTKLVNPIENEYFGGQIKPIASHHSTGQSGEVQSDPTYNGSVRSTERQDRPEQVAPPTSQDSVIGSNIGNSSVPECNLEKDIKVPVLEIEIPVPEIEVRPLETKTYSCHDRVITLKKMLSEDFKTCETKNKIRYFHIPYNNMQWVEEAISRYFDEFEKTKKPKTDLALRDEYWRGQQYGPDEYKQNQHYGLDEGITVHSRHLRSLCEKFSTDTKDPPLDKQNNVVSFMPYLHWDTDRYRAQMVDVITELIIKKEKDLDKNRHELEKDYDKKRQQKRRKWKIQRCNWELEASKASGNTTIATSCSHEASRSEEETTNSEFKELTGPKYFGSLKPGEIVPRLIEDAFLSVYRYYVEKKEYERDAGSEKFTMGKSLCRPKIDRAGRLSPAHPLAQLLVDAARLFETMETFQQREVLRAHLFPGPSFLPVHPRRSLDQAYFWKLRTTRRRDRDQVVYRYTMPKFLHRVRFLTEKEIRQKKWDRKIQAPLNLWKRIGWARSINEPRDWEWTRHEDEERFDPKQAGQSKEKPKPPTCKHCREQSCKVARAVMVDQLWMWVLDENTILTCFPRRYGMSKNDSSDVHNSILKRVKDQSKPSNRIGSVFDLALIIMDECFNTFFDKTKTIDKRPQMLDIFAESIGQVTNKQTIYFRHIWEQTQRLRDAYQSKARGDISSKHLLTLLDLKTESKLQEEIRDIINELDIMNYIIAQQKDVIVKFKEKVQPMLQEDSGFKKRADELTVDVENQINEIGALTKSAESTAKNVDDLINLKQQQASVVQAYQATKQGEETLKQGKAIMLFTVMTIIFLPLSFMSSIFGMNAVELGGNSTVIPWKESTFTPLEHFPTTFQGQMFWIFIASAIIVFIVLFLAFSSLAQTLIMVSGSLFKFLRSWIVTRLLYRLWLMTWWRWINEPIDDPSLSDLSAKVSKDLKEKTERMEIVVREQEYKSRRDQWDKYYDPNDPEEMNKSGQGIA